MKPKVSADGSKMSALTCFIFAVGFSSVGYFIGHNIGVAEGLVKGRRAVREYYESKTR